MDVSWIKQNYLNIYCAFFAHMHVRFWRLKWVTLYKQNRPLKLQSNKRRSHLNLEFTFKFHCWCVDENVFKWNSLTLVEVRLFHFKKKLVCPTSQEITLLGHNCKRRNKKFHSPFHALCIDSALYISVLRNTNGWRYHCCDCTHRNDAHPLKTVTLNSHDLTASSPGHVRPGPMK